MKLSVDQFKGDERKHFSKQQVMNIRNLLPKKTAAVPAALQTNERNSQATEP